MTPIMQMTEEAASKLGASLVTKVNEVIKWITANSKADVAWKTEAETRLQRLEQDMALLKAQNRGLKIAKGKAVSAKNKAIEAQALAASKLAEARRLLN